MPHNFLGEGNCLPFFLCGPQQEALSSRRPGNSYWMTYFESWSFQERDWVDTEEVKSYFFQSSQHSHLLTPGSMLKPWTANIFFFSPKRCTKQFSLLISSICCQGICHSWEDAFPGFSVRFSQDLYDIWDSDFPRASIALTFVESTSQVLQLVPLASPPFTFQSPNSRFIPGRLPAAPWGRPS